MGNRVGAQIERGVAGPLSLGPDPGDSLFIAITAERGPADKPVLITSARRLAEVFGGATPFADGTRISTGRWILDRYFGSGGRRAYVVRVTGASAAIATKTVQDRAGTPVNTLRIDAKGAGAWIDGVVVTVADGTRTNTFSLTVKDSLGDTLKVWDNLTMASTALARVNDGSDIIQLVDLASATAAPDNMPANGDVTFDAAADGGVDDNAPAAARIVGTDTSGVKTGLKSLRSHLLGRGFVCAPDLDTDVTVIAELVSQGEAYFRIPCFSSQPGATPSAAITQRGAVDAFNAAFYYPRLRVRDDEAGEIVTIPAYGDVLGRWLRAINNIGPGKAPAGRDWDFPGILGLETQANGEPLVDDAVAETLLGSNVNPIWDKDGSGPRCLGARASSSDDAWQQLHHAYLWTLIASTFKRLLDAVAFDIADELLFSTIESGMYTYMAGLFDVRAFSGSLPAQGDTPDQDADAFAVQCDESLLTDLDRQQFNIRAESWFRPVGVAETIKVRVSKLG